MNALAGVTSGPQASFSIEVVDDEAGLDALAAPWRRLEEHVAEPVPCQRFEWSRLWWRVYARERDRPWIIVVRDASDIVGLCPLYLRDATRPWGRRLRFIASGEPEHEEVASEFLDVIALPVHRSHVALLALAAIAERGGWREIRLPNVLESAALAARWHAGMGSRGRVTARGLRYRVPLVEDWDAYLRRLAPRFRSRMRAEVRAYDAGRQRLVATDGTNVEDVFDWLVRLHQQRWQQRDRNGAFASRRFRDFHRELLRVWLPRGEALLRRLVYERGEAPAGVLYNFRWRGREFYYQSGLDPDRGERRSPGLACHVGAIRKARADGLDSYDFMLGKASSYKAAYGCETEPVVDLSVDRRGMIGIVLDRAFAVCGME